MDLLPPKGGHQLPASHSGYVLVSTVRGLEDPTMTEYGVKNLVVMSLSVDHLPDKGGHQLYQPPTVAQWLGKTVRGL
jgi:hypothetical protein